jgi:hypothetical protein
MSTSYNIQSILNDNVNEKDISKSSIDFTSVELFDVLSNSTEYLNSQPNSNPTSVQTSSTSSEDESETTKAIYNVAAFSGGGGGGNSLAHSLPSLNLKGLKRHNTESDILDLPSADANRLGLRISIPCPEKLQQQIINKRSDKNGLALLYAHESARDEMSPSFKYPDNPILKGPHFPKMKKSLSWSTRADMTDEVIAHIKEFNKFSPVAKNIKMDESESENDKK